MQTPALYNASPVQGFTEAVVLDVIDDDIMGYLGSWPAHAVMQGSLHIVEDAPVFQRTAYAIYHKDSEKKETVAQLIESARQSVVDDG